MMNVSGILYKILLNDAPTNALVAGRIYPVVVPQDAAMPAVRIEVGGIDPNETKTGVSTEDNVYIGITTYANTYKTAAEIDAAIRNVIDQNPQEVTAGNIIYTIDGCRFIGSEDGFEGEVMRFKMMSDYVIRLKRTTTNAPTTYTNWATSTGAFWVSASGAEWANS